MKKIKPIIVILILGPFILTALDATLLYFPKINDAIEANLNTLTVGLWFNFIDFFETSPEMIMTYISIGFFIGGFFICDILFMIMKKAFSVGKKWIFDELRWIIIVSTFYIYTQYAIFDAYIWDFSTMWIAILLYYLFIMLLFIGLVKLKTRPKQWKKNNRQGTIVQ